jgi:hypothetical protein
MHIGQAEVDRIYPYESPIESQHYPVEALVDQIEFVLRDPDAHTDQRRRNSSSLNFAA